MFSRLETAPGQWGGNAGVPGGEGKSSQKKEEGGKSDSVTLERL